MCVPWRVWHKLVRHRDASASKTLYKAHMEQIYHPLTSLFGYFITMQLGWFIIEKDAYTVVATLECIHWTVAAPDSFDLYADHNNLTSLFDHFSTTQDLLHTSLRKGVRCSVRLSIYHIKDKENVWADLLSRSSVLNNLWRHVLILKLFLLTLADL